MRTEFTRNDLLVQIDKESVSFISGKTVDRFDVSNPDDLGEVLKRSTAARHWTRRFPDAPYTLLFRICLDIRDRKQQARNWESALFQSLDQSSLSRPPLIMRVSPVRARSANIPFTLPLRFIETSAARGYIQLALKRVFYGSLRRYEDALRTLTADWKRWDQFELPHEWPTIEVLHFNKLPPFPEGQMLSGDAAVPGTLGWLVEKLVTWQVRLVVISCNRDELDQMRVFASALLARGGPAVLVEALENHKRRREFYDVFYEQLIHDFPLDAAWRNAHFDPGRSFDLSLFAGGGREEQLRPSSIAMRLAEFGSPRNQARRSKTLDQTFVRRVPLARRREVRLDLEQGVKKIRSDWKTFRFEFRESEGMLPLADDLTSFRTKLVGSVTPSSLHPPTTQARFVNCSFWEETATHELRQIDQKIGHFNKGQLYQLGIQIGPKSRNILTVNETALFEEVFKWKPEMKGVWIEIGVSGIDFDVVGDPVQRLATRSRQRAN